MVARSLITFSTFHQRPIFKTLSNIRRMASGTTDVLFEEINNKGVITLNRPKALNALNLSMVDKIDPVLRKWENQVDFVIIKGAGDKAFCAGGDVRAVVEAGLRGDRLGFSFFKSEYSLNGLIGRYKKPYIALIDGICMGGGVGLSVHGRYRVATEKTLFAMPETIIGLFPDVGTSYILSRMPAKLGLYLALTGHRLTGQDVVSAGIASHYCESSKIKELENHLIDNCRNNEDIQSAFNEFCSPLSKDFSLASRMEKIHKCFSAKSVEEIIKNLEEDQSYWAHQTLDILNRMSPTSLKITMKELELAGNMSLQECLSMEYRLAVNCLMNKDFYEGVRALLIDKDKCPKWDPPTLEEVTDQIVESYFMPLPEDQEFKNKL